MKEIISSTKEEKRVNVFLRDHGIGSRRTIDGYIKKGFVTINKKKASLGDKVSYKDKVTITTISKEYVYALYHKPRGETTAKLPTLPSCEPIGRLDKESEGLLLYTNDYRIVDRLLNPVYEREKEYEIMIREKATPRVVTILKKGITTQEANYKPVKAVSVYKEGYALRIILTEGKKHEIRRMLNALHLTVLSLKRVRIMSFVLHGLLPKKIHMLSSPQIKTLYKDCKIEN